MTIKRTSKTITIFGSSFPQPDTFEYDFAYKLGLSLTEAGFNICNGGGGGTMEATAKGASDAGGVAIGVTVKGFYEKANNYISEEIITDSLFERITELVNCADGFIVLAGGTGTLLEFATIIEFINKNMLEYKPIAISSKFWGNLIELINERNVYEYRRELSVFKSDDVEAITSYFVKQLL